LGKRVAAVYPIFNQRSTQLNGRTLPDKSNCKSARSKAKLAGTPEKIISQKKKQRLKKIHKKESVPGSLRSESDTHQKKEVRG